MIQLRYFVALASFLALGTFRANAQEAQPPADPLTALQQKQTLTDEDTAALRQWIEERLGLMAGNEPVQAQKALAELRTKYSGTPAFKSTFARICVELIAPAYRGAGNAQAAMMLILLGQLDDPAARPIFIEALKDERVAVRTVAAVGLRALRPRLVAAGGTTVEETLSALAATGAKETSKVTLESIYRAMNFQELPTTPDARLLINSLLTLLEARAAEYEAGRVHAEGAEAVGLRILPSLVSRLEQADRDRLIRILAPMLKYSVTRYVTGDQPLYAVHDRRSSRSLVELRNDTELTIEAAESLLKELLNPQQAPAISDKMKTGGEKTPTEVKIEMNKWADLLATPTGKDYHMEAEAVDLAPPGDDEQPAPDEGDGG